MNIFPSIKQELTSSLSYLFHNKASSTQVVRYTFKKNKKWGSRDRKVFSEVFFDIVRFLGGYSEFVGKDLLHAQELNDDDFQKVVEAYLDDELRSKAESQEPKVMAHKDLLIEVEKNFNNQELSRGYFEECLTIPSVFLRVNTSKVSSGKLVELLEEEGVSTNEISESCLELPVRKNVLQLSAYKSGLFEVQDGASQGVAPFLELGKKSRVADTCAGAGGKALHMADLMNGQGRVLALDISERRLEELKKRSKRSGFQNIETRVIKNNKTLKRLSGSFDRVLIDAPCSGTGTFRRKPEGKIHFRKERLDELVPTQKEILASHSKLLKPGGLLVYATCSVLKVENELQVESFLKENESFELVEQKTNSMGENGFDGFYMAKLKKF